MRQIKFRGKHITTGVWLHGSHYNDCGEEYILPNTLGSAVDYEDYQVDPNTVGEFIGLTDKKGNEIYEGDIICAEFADGSGGNNLVGWNETFAGFGLMNRYEYRSIKEGYDFAYFNGYILDAFRRKAIIFEKVGNIHDNPELIEKC